MTKRKTLTEQSVLSIIRNRERFVVNPLAYRNRSLVKLLESMRKRGLITCRMFKLDWVEYYLPKDKT